MARETSHDVTLARLLEARQRNAGRRAELEAEASLPPPVLLQLLKDNRMIASLLDSAIGVAHLRAKQAKQQDSSRTI